MRRNLPFSAVIGASSLRRRRSGVGRMTLEIIEAVRSRSDLAALSLLIDGRLRNPDTILAQLAINLDVEPATQFQAYTLASRTKQLIAGLPGVQDARRIKQHLVHRRDLATLRSAGGGRVVYHEPNMITEPFDGPTVVTVNDLSWHHHPEYHPQERLQWIARHLRRTLDGAARFVAISRFTFESMVQELGLPAERIDLVPLAAAAQFKQQSSIAAAPALAKYALTDRGYILSVATLEPRKNLDRLVSAHAALPNKLRKQFPLVIVGGGGWGATLSNPAVEQARRAGTLYLLGYLPDAELVSLYARAAVFAYVSIYEGFGLPVLEAMATGTPVLASSTTATGETAGNAAELANPLDVEAITTGLRRLLEDEDYSKMLGSLGLRQSRKFDWDRTATGLIESWTKALG